MKKVGIIISIVFIGSMGLNAQCVKDTNNIYKFTDNQIDYEVIKENKTWEAAQSCAVARGGQLSRINNQAEQDSVFANLNRAGITTNNTTAPDGGGAAYVWLGGNDTLTEGNWVWDNPSGSNAQFWMGARNGNAVNSLYNNWGNEPDDFQGQDALGIALTAWPFGVAGEWNDVDENDTLYYLIEYPAPTGLEKPIEQESAFTIFPNPANEVLHIKADFDLFKGHSYQVVDAKGSQIMTGELTKRKIDIQQLKMGMYWLEIEGIGSIGFQKQ